MIMEIITMIEQSVIALPMLSKGRLQGLDKLTEYSIIFGINRSNKDIFQINWKRKRIWERVQQLSGNEKVKLVRELARFELRPEVPQCELAKQWP